MRGIELPGLLPSRRRDAEAREELAVMGHDADPRSQIRRAPVDRHVRPYFANQADRACPAMQRQGARPVQVVELRLIAAFSVENLNAVVLPVGDVNPAVIVAADVVRQVELARLRARLAPREQGPAI